MHCFGRSRRARPDDDWEVALARASGDSEGELRARAQRRHSHLFKDKHVLARPAAKDRLKKIINVKKGGADGDDAPDHEFLALAKIYSEIDAGAELTCAARSRESLGHLLPFVMNALLYGFRDHELPPGSSNASNGGRYAKKSSQLRLRSPSVPNELSLNGTSHLVKAQCERQLESFLHEQSMRSVYFALDCAWYLNTSLLTGPQVTYHRTMTLLLSMESVVTNYAVPGDLFKKADLTVSAAAAADLASAAGGARDADAITPAAPDAAVQDPMSVHVSRTHSAISAASDTAQPPPTHSMSTTAGGGGEIVAVGSGGTHVNLDTTGDGARDLKVSFQGVGGADEAKIRQWLTARSDRANLFHAELDFIKCLTDISAGLFNVDRELRRDLLRRELEKLNSYIPKNVFIPTYTRQHRVLRIVPEAAHVFSTKERVPYLLVLEVEDLGPPPESEVVQLKHGGLRRKGSLSAHGVSHGYRDGGHGNAGGSSSGAAPDARSSGTKNAPAAGAVDEHAPNQPGEKFAFSPEMTTADLTGAEHSNLTDPGSTRGLVKKESSFRVDTDHGEDRRPPDEELIKAMGEPWAVKSDRLRRASPFGSNPKWKLVSCIVKARDQLRQEMFAQRLIQEFTRIFQRAGLQLRLLPYKIVATSSEAGLIETIVDAKSIDSIKKDSPNIVTLQDYFVGRFGGRGSQGYKRAVRNFVQSMAAYSVVSYLLNIKDRHNGNLMIDSEGHIVHIDFGFLLSNSPGGNMEFERAPFKLTKEMAQVMGGPKSGPWKLFRRLSIQGYVEACNHVDKILLMVDIFYPGNEKLPCFIQGREYVLSNLRERFGVDLSPKERAGRMARLIDYAHGNWTTKAYDQFQRLSLGIAK